MKKWLCIFTVLFVSSNAHAGMTIWVAGEDDLMSWWAQLAQYFGY